MRLKGCFGRNPVARNPAHRWLSDLSMISISKTDEMNLKIVTTSGIKTTLPQGIQAAARKPTA